MWWSRARSHTKSTSRSLGAVHRVQRTFSIEGLHDAVRNYARSIFQNLLVSFFTARYGEKTTKNARTFDLLHGRIWNFIQVCVLIFLSLGCNLVMWYELNKKLWYILLLFPIPSVNRKPTWRSRVWWLAKLLDMTSHENPPLFWFGSDCKSQNFSQGKYPILMISNFMTR